MSANWFFQLYPPSLSAIENELRLAFWTAGLDSIWFSCTKDTVPYVCQGIWHKEGFTVEWAPGDYISLKMDKPNQGLLEAFERAVKHRALAAYRDNDGKVVVEWRTKNGAARLEELNTSGVRDLQKLDK
ncbi:MAG: hypothetical protein M1132_14110 [Chloroflexi bacterium]|nr:hypothetical protein [Chloroflexota bacterium]